MGELVPVLCSSPQLCIMPTSELQRHSMGMISFAKRSPVTKVPIRDLADR